MSNLNHLERALDAEDECERLRGRIRDLEGRLKSAINADPTTASRALSWIGRAENAEVLIRQVLGYVKQRSLSSTDLPNGWVSRAEAQIASVEILQRDLAPLVEKPDETWADYVDRESGRRSMFRP